MTDNHNTGGNHTRHTPHAKRFTDLDPTVQKFLTNLREQDVEELVDALELIRMMRHAGKFIRYSWMVVVALAMGMVYITDGWRKAILFFTSKAAGGP